MMARCDIAMLGGANVGFGAPETATDACEANALIEVRRRRIDTMCAFQTFPTDARTLF